MRLEKALIEKYPDCLKLDEIEVICKELKKKLSNAERRFRFDKKCPHLYLPNERIWNEKGNAIIGYKLWTPSEPLSPVITDKPKQQTLLDVRRMD